jgi:hypothetical protein
LPNRVILNSHYIPACFACETATSPQIAPKKPYQAVERYPLAPSPSPSYKEPTQA